MRHALMFHLAVALLAAPALASEPATPVAPKDISAGDVAATPAVDLNLKHTEIPALLTAALEEPYSLTGLGSCRRLAAAIGELDGVLGDDVDMPAEDGKRVRPGQVARSVVRGFIPFGGVIREISGANGHERQLQTAIASGVARRSFLKGTGQARGCAYPARSATAAMGVQR
jgi:hypothetical protein